MSLFSQAMDAIFGTPVDPNNKPSMQKVADLFKNISAQVDAFADIATITTLQAPVGSYVYCAENQTVYRSIGAATNQSVPGASGVHFEVSGTYDQSDVRSFGAVSNIGTDSAPAFIKAAKNGRVHIPVNTDGSKDYRAGAYAETNFNNAVWSADPGVTFDMTYDPGYGPIFAGSTFLTDVRLYGSQNKRAYIAPQTMYDYRKYCLPMPATATTRRRVALDGQDALTAKALEVPIFASDTFTASTVVRTGGKNVQFTNTGAGTARGAFFDLGPWETISASIAEAESQPAVGVIIRGTTGYSIVYSNGTDAGQNFTNAYKPTGGAIQNNTPTVAWPLLGQTRETTFEGKRALWSVSRVDGNRAEVRLNNRILCRAMNCGDILDVGFVSLGNTAAFNINGMVIERRTDFLHGLEGIYPLRFYGDSTVSDHVGGWASLMPQLLDGFGGSVAGKVENRAIPGSTAAQTLAQITADGANLGGRYVFVTAGTNDVQGLTNLATFESNVLAIISAIQSTGRVVVWMTPWHWYPQAAAVSVTGIPAKGLDTFNSNRARPYRTIIEREVALAGGVLVDPTRELPHPDAAFLLLTPDHPGVRDNIHQDQKANQLYAMAAAKAVVDHYFAMPESIEATLPAAAFLNGASGAGFVIVADKSGMITLSGTINITSVTNQTIIRLPRWARPSRNMNALVTAFNTQVLNGRVTVQTDGQIVQADIPATSSLLFINITYKAAAS